MFVAQIATVQITGMEPTQRGNAPYQHGILALTNMQHISGPNLPSGKLLTAKFRQVADTNARLHMRFDFWNSLNLTSGRYLLVEGSAVSPSGMFTIVDALSLSGPDASQVQAYQSVASLLKTKPTDHGLAEAWKAALASSNRDLADLALIGLSAHHVLAKDKTATILQDVLATPATALSTRKNIAFDLLKFPRPGAPLASEADQTRLLEAYASAVVVEANLGGKVDLAYQLYQLITESGNSPAQQRLIIHNVQKPESARFLGTVQVLVDSPEVLEKDKVFLRQLGKQWQFAQ